MQCVKINWMQHQLELPIPDHCEVRILEPHYPPALKLSEIESVVAQGIHGIHDKILSAAQIAIILEDCSRRTATAPLVEAIYNRLTEVRGGEAGLEVIVAAGAHFNLTPKALARKAGNVPFRIHNATKRSDLLSVGKSTAGIPFIFNKSVAEADLRLSISTVNIHPLAGYSGGGKILLPGVAGLETIFPFHALPQGTPGVYPSAMRELITEVTDLLPIAYSWQLLADPAGNMIRIFGGNLSDAHRQAIAQLEPMITVSKAEKEVELLLAGCQPFNLNLLSTFKALNQLPQLVEPGGRLVLFNEATQGTGDHHWRNDPETVRQQKIRYQSLFSHLTVGVYAPGTPPAVFTDLFPENFHLLENPDDLRAFITFKNLHHILVLPYAPVTLVK